MLKVAFPIGEFFHEHHYHHSAEEECTHATGKQCEHKAHLSDTHEHPHDCIFFQLHSFFTQPYFAYKIYGSEAKITFFNVYQPVHRVEIYTPSRAPPAEHFTTLGFAAI
ncbi:hypothetical protein [Capnocytophaga felis]|uniref:Uncharacterized protein n=1 Tax=Capnocytophaga felis TaxID=2267611 RepID=A0A5M4B6G1_9FLAO|nr:hypothetical protein [Capnocytophaga felis]GET45108.1 hypothetical protein RCZ01_04100 [Capnocytophaga felis]GET47728.1 hypothetical protein RCZ02_05590 [Capnocytophaga felis]